MWKFKKLKTFDLFVISLLCYAMIMMGVWAIDTGFSAQIVMMATGKDAVATNGWWVRSPIQQYHIGLFFVIIPSFSQFLLVAWLLFTREKNDRNLLKKSNSL